MGIELHTRTMQRDRGAGRGTADTYRVKYRTYRIISVEISNVRDLAFPHSDILGVVLEVLGLSWGGWF